MTLASPNEAWASSAWDLSDLLPDASTERVAEELAELRSEVSRFESRRDDLSTIDSDGLIELVEQYEAICRRMQVVGAYGSLWFAADTQSEEALAYRNRVSQDLTAMQNSLLFLTVWWKALDADEAEALLPREESDSTFFLREQRRFRDYTLPEASESLINLKDADGVGALLTVYSMLTNRLEFKLEVDSETRTMTRDQIMGFVMSADAGLRKAAYQEVFRVFEGESKVLAQIYVHRARDWRNENVGLRSYKSPIAVRNRSNDIPDLAVERLLETARRNVGVFHRYFRLKAGWLGQSKLSRYDLYAPLRQSDERIEYSDAVAKVLDTFARFDPRMGAEARRVFRDCHIDSEIRAGKKAGAFCATVLPEMSPWVLVNYSGRLRDVATLAHELGHAVHSMLAADHSLLTQHASLPLAETASVFAEMLMTDRLLGEQPDSTAQRELLSTALDDIYATVLRQSYFVLFEIDAHRAIEEGCAADELHEMYMANLAEQFGDSVDVAPEFCREWVSIPHIYSTPFYCYAYAFGQLLVLSLYSRYKQDPEGFMPGYLKLLSYGGSARPETILGEAGVDMSDTGFWQGGFDLVREMIDRLEALEPPPPGPHRVS